MRVCDLNSGLGTLAAAFTHLKESWQAAQGPWHDQAASQFEEQHLKPIPGKLQSLINAVQRLGTAVQKAELECRDHGEGQQL